MEAGLCLYGDDINENTTPVEAGLAWTIGKFILITLLDHFYNVKINRFNVISLIKNKTLHFESWKIKNFKNKIYLLFYYPYYVYFR